VYGRHRGNNIANTSTHKTQFSGLALYPFGAGAGMSTMLSEGYTSNRRATWSEARPSSHDTLTSLT
jgi:hypothetical protein